MTWTSESCRRWKNICWQPTQVQTTKRSDRSARQRLRSLARRSKVSCLLSSPALTSRDHQMAWWLSARTGSFASLKTFLVTSTSLWILVDANETRMAGNQWPGRSLCDHYTSASEAETFQLQPQRVHQVTPPRHTIRTHYSYSPKYPETRRIVRPRSRGFRLIV